MQTRRHLLLAGLLMAAARREWRPTPSTRACSRRCAGGSRARSRGGRVLAVAGVPGEPEHFYFGAVNGGVWETECRAHLAADLRRQPIGSIGALALAPSNPRVIYVGTGEADMRSDIAQGNGMYRSTDGGRTWAHVGLDDTQQIGRIVVDPRDPTSSTSRRSATPTVRTPSAASSARPTAARPGRRVLCSSDDEHRRDRPGVRARSTRDRVRGALADAAAALEHLSAVERAGRGLLPLDDGGEHWTPLAGRLPAEGSVASASRWRRASPRASTRIVDAKAGGLYRSDDGGATGRARAATADLGTRLVLRRGHGRPERRRHGLRLQHHPLPFDRRRQDVRADQGRAGRRRLPRALDRSGRVRAA